ncbi:MAG: carbohydrate-binding domain-containing protein [Bacteroidales bacterium]
MKTLKQFTLSLFLLVNFIFCSCNKEEVLIDDANSEIIINNEDFEKEINDALANNNADHEEDSDYIWDTSTVVKINLMQTNVEIVGEGASLNGTAITIEKSGNYLVTGTLDEGRLIVNTSDNGIVRVILNGAQITCSNSSPLFIRNSVKTILILLEETNNILTDSNIYTIQDADSEPDAVICSKDNLTIYGNGSLVVNSNYNDGIASKDGLIIKSGNIEINSIDDGIRGKDYLEVKGGNVTINASGDGLKSDNDTDATKGFIYISKAGLNIKSGGDAISAQTDVLISDGTIEIETAGGSSKIISESVSAKGIKGLVNLIIDNGSFTINSADDAIHTNGNLVLNGGTFDIQSGDDGMHADSVIYINGGNININKSYEGIESANIQINSGNLFIISSDDGINIASGTSVGGFPGQGGSQSNGNNYLYILGGNIKVYSQGDGIDINGSVVMTNGSLIVHGPVANDNSAVDYDGTYKISGGYLLAAGSSGMSQAPGSTSSQYSLLINFKSVLAAGTLVHLETSEGDEAFTFSPSKKFQSIAFSSSTLKNGSKYNLYTGGNSTGTEADGLYNGGEYTSGVLYTSFTISSITTKIGNAGFNPMGK